MLKPIIYTVLSALFIIGTVVAVNMTKESDNSDMSDIQKFSPEIHADWPVYNAEKILNDKADLIAFVTVKDIKDKEKTEIDDDLNATIATLTVDNVVLGDSYSKEIKLDQAIDPVVKGDKYLLFLAKRGDYYYIVDKNSKVKEVNGKYQIEIKGLEGNYLQTEFSNKVKDSISKN